MTAEVTYAQAVLTVENAAAEIDRVLRETLTESRPGYLLIPADVAKAPLAAPTWPLEVDAEASDPATLAELRGAVQAELEDAASIAVLAGILVHRMGAEDALQEVLYVLGVPRAVSLWGRRVIDESSPHYVGPYIGAVELARDALGGRGGRPAHHGGRAVHRPHERVLLAAPARAHDRDRPAFGAHRGAGVRVGRDGRRAQGRGGGARRDRARGRRG